MIKSIDRIKPADWFKKHLERYEGDAEYEFEGLLLELEELIAKYRKRRVKTAATKKG